MNSYEITERGKIFIAVILVAILLILSSVILAIGSCSGSSPPDDPPAAHEPSPTPQDEDPVVSNTPLPTPGSGFDPPVPTPDPTPTPTPEPPTPTPTPPHGGNGDGDGYGDRVPEFGPVGLNITEGTMLFMFSPAYQDLLDEETVSMLSDFLSSPKNTANAQVQVEMPDLSEDETTLLLSAVTKAFSNYNIKTSDIVYVKNRTEVTESNFEVKLSFYVAPVLK
ncbi:MAG: hypothetical protein FWD44_10240 [Oscillospiraceae bacterium]|nr:hypothetical protein [Oscillospiraceae bacterium]